MLWTVATILAMLWMLGLVTQVTMGGLLHVLLFVAVVVMLAKILEPRKSADATQPGPGEIKR